MTDEDAVEEYQAIGARMQELEARLTDAQKERDSALARAERLETALRDLERAASEHANEHGCPGYLGARLSDARATLSADPKPDREDGG